MNKFYIQIVLFLLSIFAYVNNKTLATEPSPKKKTPKVSPENPNESTTPKAPERCLTSEEIYEKNKHLLCTNPKETKEAIELMKEAVKHLESHAARMDGYKIFTNSNNYDVNLYKKNLENHTDIERIDYIVYGSDKYNEVIKEIWDPDHASPFNNGDVKIARVYNPNLVIIQQRYKKKCGSPQKYFYALATKVQISENTTIIAYVSADINDHNPSKKKYENTIVKKANSFKTDINSEEDIRKGKLKKTFVNLAGYYIQDYIGSANVTYIGSIDGHSLIKRDCFCGLCFNCYHIHI
ncbi:Acidic phosphoprotein precursor PCEMA1, putative [Plasmodium chabaudi chabaudi]|uniref:Acidic phosphoprotein PCEMA1, putative n=1 Tax=Plasmodium chabaudi chabaudi TaxID=31271 RepID=A0A1D3LBJ0_PLACU|nr:Acidic phosphoprotein precursor PCEMA1, putative [Plasmodium chabaudi chabaudi]